MKLPGQYRARGYRGRSDHPDMARVLSAYREHAGDPELPTSEQFDATYSHLTDCDPDNDIALVESDGVVVGYSRASWSGDDGGPIDCIAFAPTDPAHLTQALFDALVTAQEAHMVPWARRAPSARYMAYAHHPGPDAAATGEAAWLEARGYAAIEWEASLLRPHLDDVPDLRLPDGLDVRPVEPDQMRQIWEDHWEAFRGEWDFKEARPEDIDAELAEPYIDHTMWKVAWVGDQVVGQVKSYINAEENDVRGYRRGYTENISTHREWRGRGIAGALLAMSLRELRDRGMTEAALGVDTNSPGGAFQLYTKLGFELQNYVAVYVRPIDDPDVPLTA